jgi:hypothetical protein
MRHLSVVLIVVIFLSCNQDEYQYKNVQKENTVEAYRQFIKKYPKSKFAIEVGKKIGDLLYQAARNLNTEQAYLDFIKTCPTSEHVLTATEKAAELGWRNISKKDSITVFANYIARYPNAPYISKAKDRFEELAFAKTAQATTSAEIKAFLEAFPNGKWSAQARQKLAKFERSENSWQAFSTGLNGRYCFSNSTITSTLSYNAEIEIVISDGTVHLAYEGLLVTDNGSQFHFHKTEWAYTGQMEGNKIAARSDSGAGITSFEVRNKKVYAPMLGTSEIVPYDLIECR